MATVVLVGTLDTKGVEYGYLRDRLVEHGTGVVLVDAGIAGEPRIEPDVTGEEVAGAAGKDLKKLADAGDRGAAVEAIARGAGETLKGLYAEGRLDGVLGCGGSGGSALVTRAMRELPVGVPKLMVSTVASGNTRPYVGAVDVTSHRDVVALVQGAVEAFGRAVSYAVSQPEDVDVNEVLLCPAVQGYQRLRDAAKTEDLRRPPPGFL